MKLGTTDLLNQKIVLWGLIRYASDKIKKKDANIIKGKMGNNYKYENFKKDFMKKNFMNYRLIWEPRWKV